MSYMWCIVILMELDEERVNKGRNAGDSVVDIVQNEWWWNNVWVITFGNCKDMIGKSN